MLKTTIRAEPSPQTWKAAKNLKNITMIIITAPIIPKYAVIFKKVVKT